MKNFLFILLTLFLISCNEKNNQSNLRSADAKDIDIEAELKSIEKTRQTFMRAVKETDYETIGKIVTKDFKAISPGSIDWKEMYETSKNQGPFPYDSIFMSPKETVIVSDSIAYDFGVSQVYYTNAEGNVVELNNSFLAILKKEGDGVWKLHREVASSNIVD